MKMEWIDFIFRKACLNSYVLKRKRSKYISIYGLFTLEELKFLANKGLDAEYSDDVKLILTERNYYEVD